MRTTASGGLRGLVFGPIGVLYVVFLLAPISYFLLLSVFKYSPMEMFIPGFTLENYDRFLGDSYYQGVLLTTFRIALITTLCSLLGAYPLAYFLARYPTRWRGVLLFLVIAPLMSGVIVRTYAWIVILGEYGAVNRSAEWIGLIEQPLKLLNTEFAVIVALVHILLPFMVFPLFSGDRGTGPGPHPGGRHSGRASVANILRGHPASQPAGDTHGFGAGVHPLRGRGGHPLAHGRARTCRPSE